jgi:hypothetical protein
MAHAMIRGITSILKESIESTSIASICSVARMFASSAPMPAPTRPAISKPARSGPISLKKASDWTSAIFASAPNWTSVVRVCRARTSPRAKAEDNTSGSDLQPAASICRRIIWNSKGGTNTRSAARSPNRPMFPMKSRYLHNSSRARESVSGWTLARWSRRRSEHWRAQPLPR